MKDNLKCRLQNRGQNVRTMSCEALEQRMLLSSYVFRDIANFNYGNGAVPTADVTLDSRGDIFGTTSGGGGNGDGTVFEIAAGGSTINAIASFDGENGKYPEPSPTIDANGNLFGTTNLGGTNGVGTVWEIANGTTAITALASFDFSVASGAGPLTLDGNGDLFGSAYDGGPGGSGAIWKLAQGSHLITDVASFYGPNGANPGNGIITDSSGDMFGTAANGGDYGAFDNGGGVVFEIANGSNSAVPIAYFNGNDGAKPSSTIVIDSGGNIFGTTESGGPNGDGTIWEIANGTTDITMLAAFDGANGSHSNGALAIDSSGNIFGTTGSGGADGDGTDFELVYGSKTITTLHDFDGPDGSTPTGGVVLDVLTGDLFGATSAGGDAMGDGSIFELSPTDPAISGVSPTSYLASNSDQPMLINGSNFESGCTLTFVDPEGTPIGGNSAKLTFISDGQLSYLFNDAGDVGLWTVSAANPTGQTSGAFSFMVTPGIKGVDYSDARPSASAMEAAGYNFVIRYVSAAGNAKNITGSESQSLESVGLSVILVFESTATSMLGGYSVGVADAETAVAVATVAGAPQSFFCYFACDFDATVNDQAEIDAYLDGAASVMGGVSRVGIYGGYGPVSRALNDGKASKAWQTSSWSNGIIDPRISLFQDQNASSGIAGCDLDYGNGTDLGQWSITWTGSGDGRSWSDPNNWSGKAVPGYLGSVLIPSDASVQMAVGRSLYTLAALSISIGGLLDVADNTIVLNFGPTDPIESLQGYLHSAYNNGSWLGSSGLTSTTVASQVAANKGTTNGLYSLGYADGNLDGSIGGAAPNQIIISPQLVADATEDGKVDFSDLLALAQNTGSTTADWVHADFNFDGVVDFNDLLLLAQNINKTNGNTSLAAEWPVQRTVALPAPAQPIISPLFSTVPISASPSLPDSLLAATILRKRHRRLLTQN